MTTTTTTTRKKARQTKKRVSLFCMHVQAVGWWIDQLGVLSICTHIPKITRSIDTHTHKSSLWWAGTTKVKQQTWKSANPSTRVFRFSFAPRFFLFLFALYYYYLPSSISRVSSYRLGHAGAAIASPSEGLLFRAVAFFTLAAIDLAVDIIVLAVAVAVVVAVLAIVVGIFWGGDDDSWLASFSCVVVVVVCCCQSRQRKFHKSYKGIVSYFLEL